MIDIGESGGLALARTRRKYVPEGSATASMPWTVLASASPPLQTISRETASNPPEGLRLKSKEPGNARLFAFALAF
ncbi:hypothetical protein, partial [Stenotrophomonas sp.]|uniref:hypothetical protein n=1 Tax=Stenotrophomonas sp. TaxID=69392 RepID=UPI00374CDC79